MLTDKFGMSFYKLCEPRFTTNLEPYKNVSRRNVLSGHNWVERVPKANFNAISKRIEKEYQKWLTLNTTTNKMHSLNFMPRTPRETRMIQAEIDGVVGWWNVK